MGPQGEQGPKGDPGPEGPQGISGLDGMDGLNCWDLNENHFCDLDSEDKNNDGICNVSDCQGSPGVAYKRIYDGDGIFLGYYSSGWANFPVESKIFYTFCVITVYNPDIPGYYIVRQQLGPEPEHLFEVIVEPAGYIGGFYFQSNDCTGQPYIAGPINPSLPINGVIERIAGQYYIVDYEVAPILRGWDINSFKGDGPCEKWTANDEQPKSPVRQIDFPFAETPLKYPLTLRDIE